MASDRHYQAIEHADILSVAEFRRHRRIHGESQSGAVADLVERAGAGVIRKLMRGYVEHFGRFVKYFLRAIAMMDVPIDDHHPLKAAFFD